MSEQSTNDDTDADKPVIVLFRHDLRVADNRALSAAADSGKPVVTVFVWDEEAPGIRPLGAARRWWLHHSLEALGEDIGKLGGKLILRRGATQDIVDEIIERTSADMVLWNRRYDPLPSRSTRS